MSKKFLTYDQQINHLKSKNLTIENEELAKYHLQHYSYYSLIGGYKGIFKLKRNGDYKPDASFNKIYSLYIFDEYLRHLVLHEIIRVEKHIKSVYSYAFCQLYGDEQKDYQNANNYNYSQHQYDVNKFLSLTNDTLNHANNYPYISYNLANHGTVPLWVIINTFTFGTISKLYLFSTRKMQNQVCKHFPELYPHQLCSMLKFLTKFRNVCAHGERLYNYRTRKTIPYMPVHKSFSISVTGGKNDFFNVLVCLKYLSQEYDFKTLIITIDEMLKEHEKVMGSSYINAMMKEMGFPANWIDILK
ncbi:MAG: Abi family protein [Ruminococcus sp.]|nr:Abi family protein [Ruminococcus sp.]